MQVTLRHFAAAREATGVESETYDVPPETTVGGLFEEATRRHPELAPLAGQLRFAVGEDFAERDTELAPDSVVALIPPVGGG